MCILSEYDVLKRINVPYWRELIKKLLFFILAALSTDAVCLRTVCVKRYHLFRDVRVLSRYFHFSVCVFFIIVLMTDSFIFDVMSSDPCQGILVYSSFLRVIYHQMCIFKNTLSVSYSFIHIAICQADLPCFLTSPVFFPFVRWQFVLNNIKSHIRINLLNRFYFRLLSLIYFQYSCNIIYMEFICFRVYS